MNLQPKSGAVQLKSLPETADIPVIAVTAHAMPDHKNQLLSAGCCSYISKPISYRPFLNEVARVLADHQHMRSSAPNPNRCRS